MGFQLPIPPGFHAGFQPSTVPFWMLPGRGRTADGTAHAGRASEGVKSPWPIHGTNGILPCVTLGSTHVNFQGVDQSQTNGTGILYLHLVDFDGKSR